jgi:hypothetical protein
MVKLKTTIPILKPLWLRIWRYELKRDYQRSRTTAAKQTANRRRTRDRRGPSDVGMDIPDRRNGTDRRGPAR